ncbi:hypothetical protein, partial [Clostridium tarantellae]|uniref:hypothetical protein n=1 Tax=Clostridium tarantellae TaxID=39493 RepID=UPI001478C0E8
IYMSYIKKIKISDSLGISSTGNIALDKNIIYTCNKDGLQKKIHKFNVNGTYIDFIKTDIPISTFTYDNLTKKFYTHYSNNYSKNTLIHILDNKGTLIETIDYSSIIPSEILYKENQPWNIESLTLDSQKNYLLFSLENSNNIYTISLNKNFINVFNFKTNDLLINKFGHTLSIDSDSSLWITYVNKDNDIKLANISTNGIIQQTFDTNFKITDVNIGGIIIDHENFSNKCVLWLSCTH